MKATLPNGQVLVGGFNGGMCTGYVASKIEIDGRDTKRMLEMLERDPANFRAHLAQLNARFECNRAPPDYITVYHGCGYFAILLRWYADIGAYDICQQSESRFHTHEEAAEDGKVWAEAEGLEFRC